MEHRNLAKPELIEHAIRNKEGFLSLRGAFITNTGKYTGRSPEDKFTVLDSTTQGLVWFHDGNKKMEPEAAQALYDRVQRYLSGLPCYVMDLRAGASPTHGINIRVVTERAWHALFAKNMFLDRDAQDAQKDPDFSVYHAPGFLADPARDHTRSEAAIVIDFSKKRVVICGTEYAGEIKKSIFTVLNFLLPLKGVLGMHCSANIGANGESAIFFGLSGTGKTTLSAEADRKLIGDDEHGWNDTGIFNFEGGCYAKVINLSKDDEPEIYEASLQFSAILENVVFDAKSRELDLTSSKYTENTRASYDISAIPNVCLSGQGPHPRHIIMLICDAFGVMPPIAKLDEHGATYHFISGYTAKVAGTERGVKEPVAVFSPCFGQPFMAHEPKVYARLLAEKMKKHQAHCWLINTGWTGGSYGEGSRLSISWTRALLHAALDGSLEKGKFVKNDLFNVLVPEAVPHIPQDVLKPECAWKNQDHYFATAHKLVAMFHNNFTKFAHDLPDEVGRAGPVLKR